MKKMILVTLILTTAFYVTSCKNNQENTVKETSIDNEYFAKETSPKVDNLETLKQKKVEVDSFVLLNPNKLTILVRQIDQSKLFQIENENFPEPEKIETIFGIVKNNSGNLIWGSEIPYSHSGDWFVTLNHYFDENGKTFAFERQTNSFNSGCAEITKETKTKYFNSDLQLIGNEYKLVGEEEQKLNKEDCFLMDFKYKVLSNIDDYSNANKIKGKHEIYLQAY
jgi:hypothetical protein